MSARKLAAISETTFYVVTAKNLFVIKLHDSVVSTLARAYVKAHRVVIAARSRAELDKDILNQLSRQVPFSLNRRQQLMQSLTRRIRK